MTVSRGKKTFLFESKNWNLFQERCTIRCTIRYRYVLIYFRQFYNRRKNLLTLIRFQNHEKKPLHRLTSLKREKTFVWLKKVKVISRCNVFLPFVMNLDLYIHISGNFIMQKILQKSPRSIILALEVIQIKKNRIYYLLVWVTSSLRIRWYFNTLCIGTASKSLKRNLPSLAACSHVWTVSRTDSSLEQSVSNNIWAAKKERETIYYVSV